MSLDIELPRTSSVDAVEGVVEPSNRGRDATAYKVTRSYRNKLGYPICIIDRSNIVATLPTTGFSKGSAELIVEYRLNFSDNVNLNWDSILNETSGVPTIEAMRALAKNTGVKVTTIGHEFIIEYSITHANLASNAFVVYYEELDIVIAKSDRAHNTVHPYSGVGQNLVLAQSDNTKGFYYRVIINDPYSEFGERYINVNGNVFKVKRTTDFGIKPGVYVHSKDECKEDSMFSPGYGTQYHSFAEADKNVALYSTSHLAASLGDAYYKQEQHVKELENTAKQELIKLNIRKLEIESKLKDMEYKYKEKLMNLESENAKLKDQVERDKLNRDNEANKDKYEYERRSRESKDHFEKRSYERKDTSELLKWLPSILTAIVAIANVMVALHKSKE